MFALGLLLRPAANVFYAGLAACGLAWLVALALAWPVRCPNCKRRPFPFLSDTTDAANWAAGVQQFWPSAVLTGRGAQCPFCKSPQ